MSYKTKSRNYSTVQSYEYIHEIIFVSLLITICDQYPQKYLKMLDYLSIGWIYDLKCLATNSTNPFTIDVGLLTKKRHVTKTMAFPKVHLNL